MEQAGDGFARAGIIGVHHQIELFQGFICPHLMVKRPALQVEGVALGLLFGVGEEVDGDHDACRDSMPKRIPTGR